VRKGGSSFGNDSMSSPSAALPVIRMRLTRVADALAIAVAVALPWSSSAVSALLTFRDVRQEAATAAGGLPVVLVAVAALGMIWADVGWGERLGGLDSFVKLLMIPILLAYFRRSERGFWVMGGYFVSCTALLALSSTLILWPQAGSVFMNYFGVPVKTTATQSGQFVTCMFALLFLAVDMFRNGRRSLAAGMVALALVFLANILTLTDLAVVPILTLVIIPVLLVLLGFKKLDTRRCSACSPSARCCAPPRGVFRHRYDPIRWRCGTTSSPSPGTTRTWRDPGRNSGRSRWASSATPRFSGTAPVQCPSCSFAPPLGKPATRPG
jgi:hypothetical protein